MIKSTISNRKLIKKKGKKKIKKKETKNKMKGLKLYIFMFERKHLLKNFQFSKMLS
jgi:hypothetical protein